MSQEASPRLLPCTKDQESSSSNGSVNEVFETDELSPRRSEGQWPGLSTDNTDNTDRTPQQVDELADISRFSFFVHEIRVPFVACLLMC